MHLGHRESCACGPPRHMTRHAQVLSAGSKFVYLKRAAALMELALCTWAMVELQRRGFTPVTTPDLVQAAVLEKCGFQPRGTNTQVSLAPAAAAGAWVSLLLCGDGRQPLQQLQMGTCSACCLAAAVLRASLPAACPLASWATSAPEWLQPTWPCVRQDKSRSCCRAGSEARHALQCRFTGWQTPRSA